MHVALFIFRKYIKPKMSLTNVNNLVLNASLLKIGGRLPGRTIYVVGNGTTLRHVPIGLSRFIRNRLESMSQSHLKCRLRRFIY